MFNIIGAASTPTEASLKYAWTIYMSYDKFHPNKVPYVPSIKMFFQAFVYRLQPEPVLDHVAKHFRKMFDDETSYYDYNKEILYLRSELSKRIITTTDYSDPSFQSSYALVDFNDRSTQHSYNMSSAFGRTPTPTHQPNPTVPYQYTKPNPNWPQNPGYTNRYQQAKCRDFPFCTFVKCSFAHLDEKGMENDKLTGIQDDPYRQQPTQDLMTRCDEYRATLPASEKTTLSTENPTKKPRYGPDR